MNGASEKLAVVFLMLLCHSAEMHIIKREIWIDRVESHGKRFIPPAVRSNHSPGAVSSIILPFFFYIDFYAPIKLLRYQHLEESTLLFRKATFSKL